MIEIENGVHDIPNEVYHNSSGVSRSGLWEFKRAPIHYWSKYLDPNREKKGATPAMKLGELTHAMILEPHEFNTRYVFPIELEEMPPAVLLKDVGKEMFEQVKAARKEVQDRNNEAKESFKAMSDGREVITMDMYNQAKALADSVWRNDVAESLFKGVKVEQSIYFTHEATGLQVKVRPDAWIGSVVTDLKTCVDASYRAFERAAYGSGYFLQAAMIHEALKSLGIKMEKFVFFCVEKTGALATVYYPLDDDALDYGINQFNQLMEMFAWCLQKNQWDSYEPQHLYLPGYAKYED